MFEQKHILKIPLFIVLFIVFSAKLFSQTFFKANISAGYTFNNAVYLNQERVYASNGMVFSVSGKTEIPLISSFFLSTGISLKAVLASGKVGLTDYRSQTLRLSVPFLAGKKINDKLSILSGASFQNNKKFSEFRARKKYNLRYDFVVIGYYQINNNWSVIKSVNYNFGLPDAYLINDPGISFSVGTSFNLDNIYSEKRRNNEYLKFQKVN